MGDEHQPTPVRQAAARGLALGSVASWLVSRVGGLDITICLACTQWSNCLALDLAINRADCRRLSRSGLGMVGDWQARS